MITFRRKLLDQALLASVPLMRGRVLDVGGKKAGKRGAFRPPLASVASWSYVNPDASTDPDFCCGAEVIPVAAESFDTAVMTEVLEYLPDAAATFSEVRRILAPGGRFLLTVPFLCPIHGDWESDRQRFTEVKLRELADGAGFETETLESMGSLGAVLYDLLHISLGYARKKGPAPRFRIATLRLCAPLFALLDRLTGAQAKFIHTGYLVVLRKPSGAGP